MNIAMEQTEEYVNGQLKNKYGDAFIRGNNGTVSLFSLYTLQIWFLLLLMAMLDDFPLYLCNYLFWSSSIYQYIEEDIGRRGLERERGLLVVCWRRFFF